MPQTLVIVGALGILVMAQLPLALADQTRLAGVALALLASLYLVAIRLPSAHPAALPLRLGIVALTVWLGWRYIYWRATQTLPFGFGLASAIAGLLLLAVEFHGFVVFLLGHLINAAPTQRQPRWLRPDKTPPTVDIFVPTYNEDPEVLRPTLIAATQQQYRADRYRVWLLDDGGTAQKLNDSDPVKAAAAQARAETLREMAQRYGAGYLTRERNQHAKAGNLNSALQHTDGELILILDCDHIPTEDFLASTVGFFLDDPKLFLVQTPHNFITPDPVERNLKLFERSPAENELFYSVMQPGLDFWHSSFFCGSAAVLRREVLTRLGGIAGQTITEDAETTLDALSLGYKTMYLNKPMVSGLQPETFSGLIVQRSRWAQGMLQIFMLKNPWRIPGLSFVQRLLYTNFAWFWGFSIARLLLILAPPAFLLFGLNLCDTTAEALVIYAAPYLFATLAVAQLYYGRVRWAFISQLYETIQSWHLTLAVIRVFLRPRSPTFQVTPKGEQLDRKFVSQLAWPLYLLLALNIAAMAWGAISLNEPQSKTGAIVFVMSWAVVDFAFLLAALGVTLERYQRRKAPRIRKRVPVQLHLRGKRISARSLELSTTGMRLLLRDIGTQSAFAQTFIGMGERVKVEFEGAHPITATVVRRHRMSESLTPDRQGSHLSLGLQFKLSDVAEERVVIQLAYGSSAALDAANARRHGHRSVLGGLLELVYLALRFGLQHLWLRVRGTA